MCVCVYECVAVAFAADAVFESVAQVLVSRSRGLVSRFNQLLCKSEPRVSRDAHSVTHNTHTQSYYVLCFRQ